MNLVKQQLDPVLFWKPVESNLNLVEQLDWELL